ncbi:MAG TPA: methionyl-tRNA formyltransferase [Anaerolineales bacterium]|nr:methionyl-tRNA formyltransferase [Anaerolineales bacterium]
MGSPEFALPSLNAAITAYDVAGVVTQPDRRSGRGRKIAFSPVKEAAQQAGISVFQPVKIRAAEAVEQLKAWAPDLIIVAAFGQILSQEVLDLPAHGSLNLHASLLPRWRGASPIQHAILHGDRQTGVTIMKMDAGLDTGPILSQVVAEIRPDDTGSTLSERLAELGARLLVETVPGYLSGRIAPAGQDEDQATKAPLLKKADGKLDFNRKAVELERQVRAFHPWPGTFLTLDGAILKVHAAEALPVALPPGARAVIDGFPVVGTTSSALLLRKVQPEGKTAMPGDVYLLGSPDWESAI